jgi:hypothetical protein
MLHRWLANIPAFDAMFITALAMACLHYGGPRWILFVAYIMGAVSIFRVLHDMSSWSVGIANQINYLARCIRDHD